MAPTTAQTTTVFLQDFLTKYGVAIQASGFIGWFLVGIAGVAIAIALFMLVGPVRNAALAYVRLVESQIGPAPKPEPVEDAGSSDSKDADVDAFVD